MVVAETERLVIRRMSTDDAGFMLQILNEPSFLEFIGDRGVRTIEDARNYILNGPLDMYAQRGFGFYLVELRETGSPIGFCGLAKRDYLDDVDIGFAFLPAYWRCGYAFEASHAMLQHARQLGLARVVATARKENLRSTNLLVKLGMAPERTFMHPDGDRELIVFAMQLD
jgi:RimJ/RimL family protein N-acetyltransferase